MCGDADACRAQSVYCDGAVGLGCTADDYAGLNTSHIALALASTTCDSIAKIKYVAVAPVVRGGEARGAHTRMRDSFTASRRTTPAVFWS